MALNTPLPKNNIKSAFSKVKEDILALKKEINQNKEALNAQKKLIEDLLTEIKELRVRIAKKSPNMPSSEKVPQEMKGSSYSFIHSNIHSFVHSLDKQTLSDMNKSLQKAFLTLTKQEFLTFLTIYQLEEDLKRPVTYEDIAQHLKLTKGV